MTEILKSILTHFGACVAGAVLGVVVMAFARTAGDGENRTEIACRNRDEGSNSGADASAGKSAVERPRASTHETV